MITLAIIGTNWITHSFVAAAHATGKYRLVAVYSRSEETARSFSARYDQTSKEHQEGGKDVGGGRIQIYTALEDLAADEAVTAVYIASPNSLHFAHAQAMLAAGKHVILEKPATSTLAELNTLFALAREKQVVCVEAWRHLHERNFAVLKASLGKVGKVYGASFTYAQYSSRYDAVLRGETPNIFSLDMSGGALVDLGVYCVAAAVDLFGAPARETYWPVRIATGADGGGRLLLEYEGQTEMQKSKNMEAGNGGSGDSGPFTVALCASKIWNSDAPSEVYGEKGTLTVPTITDIKSVKFWDAKTKQKEELSQETPEELNMKEEAEEFGRVIEERDWGAVSRCEKLSREVINVTERLRKQNGLLFAVER